MFDLDNTRQISKTFSVTTNWTRVELTFPGDTTGAFDDDNAASLQLGIWLHAGSNYTSGTLNSSAFAANTNANRAVGISSIFDSTARTFFITGLQLEVGSVATDFEHRSFAQELKLCSRYYQQWALITSGSGNDNAVAVMANFSSTAAYGRIPFINGPMRTGPSITHSNNAYFTNGASYSGLTYTVSGASSTSLEVSVTASSGNWTGGDAGWLRAQTGSGGQFALNAEI